MLYTVTKHKNHVTLVLFIFDLESRVRYRPVTFLDKILMVITACKYVPVDTVEESSFCCHGESQWI